MKVLHILGSIERSGAETMLRDSIGRFRPSGIEMELLSTGTGHGRLAPAFECAGVPVHHLPFAKSWRFFRRLRRLIRSGDYDVVHVHTERAALWVELTARLAGVKRVVRSVHNAFEFTGWLRLRRAAGRRVASCVLKVAHVFVSESVAATEIERFGTRGMLVVNGIDVDRFIPEQGNETRHQVRMALGVGPSAVAVVSVGRCTDVKQHNHVLEAVSHLAAEGLRLHYLHIGSGPNLQSEIDLARRLELEAQCHFVGERDDIVEILQASDIFVMPSRYEGLGLAALEASACELPVVAYDVPGLRNAMVNEVTGLLVAPEMLALAAAISRLAADENMRQAYGHAGRSMVLSDFSLDRWVAQHVAIYRGLALK